MSPEISTRGLLDALATGWDGAECTLGDMLDRFKERAYGVFMLIALLPSFVPGGGAVSGPLIILIGLQLLWHLEHPWVPRFISRRPLPRESIVKFRDRTAKLLRWLEKVSRPRTEVFIEHRAARIFTGLLLVVLGGLLALPIPGTNYVFGLILLAFAIALIERDGRLMLIAWVAGALEIGAMGYFSGQMAAWIAGLF